MADASTEIGSAYLSLVPSAKGLKAKIMAEIGPDMEAAGQTGGNSLAAGTEKSAGGKFGKMGLALGGLLVAGVGIAAAGIGAAISAAMDKEDAQAKLTAQLGLDETEAKSFGAVAGKAYAAGYGENLGEVNKAIVGITQELGRGSDEWLQQTTEDVLSVSKAFDQDLGGVTKAVGNLMKNDLAGSAEEALDIIARGMQEGANKADDLLDTFNEYSTMFRDLGISGKEAMGLISQGLKAGARDADTVADALKEFAIRAQDGSKTSAEGFKAIGLNAKEMTAIFAAGGPEAAQGLDLVLDSLRNMEDPVERNAAAVALFGTKAEDLGDALFSLDPSAAVDALGKVDGAAKGVNDTLSDTASSKIESWKRTIQTNIVDYIGGTVLPFLEDMVTKFNLSSIGDNIRDVANTVRTFISDVVTDIREWAATHQEDIQRVVTKGKELAESVKGYITEVIATAKQLWDLFGDDFLDVVVTKIGGALDMLKGIFDGVAATIAFVKAFITGDWSGMWQALKDLGTAALEFIGGYIDSMFGSIVEALGGDWEQMKQNAKDAWDTISTWVQEKVQAVKDTVQTMSEIPGKIRDFFQQARDGAVEKLGELVDEVRAIPGKVGDAVANFPSALVQAGRDLIQGLINGIMGKINEAKATVTAAADGVIAAAKAAFNINSPSLVFRDIGNSVGEGLILGMNDMTNSVTAATLGLTSAAITPARQPNLSSIPGPGNLEGSGSGITVNVYGADGQSVESLSDTVINKLSLNRRL